MTDKESVMQALKDSLRNQHCGFIENVGNVYAVSEETINDTLELLTEQKAEQPIVHENSYGWKFYYCPKCKQEFYQNRKQAYCDKCGKAVKWDEI